jgi:hypothetical protein
MKKIGKLNVRALIANILIAVILACMTGASMMAHGLAPHIAQVTAVAICLTLIAIPFAQTKIKMRLTHKHTGETKEVEVNKPYLMLWLMSRWTRPFAAGINREIWTAYILENLFPDNSFLEMLMDESEYVNYLTVHTPQAGAVPTVTVDPTFPLNSGNGLAVNQRTDTTVDWNIHVFWVGPFLITNAEEVQLSYNKMASVLYEMEMALRQAITENLLIYMAPTGTATLPSNLGGGTNNNILRSTGITNNDPTNIVSSVAYTNGALGNRLNFTLWDLLAAQLLLDNQNVPDEDRFMVMSPNAMRQIVADMEATKYRAALGDIYDTKAGTVSNLFGFKIFKRTQVMQYNNAATPAVKAYGSAGAATDNDAILFGQKAAFAKAFGDIHIYEQLNSPTQGGDIYSVLIRMGATKRRASELGCGVIVQMASA